MKTYDNKFDRNSPGWWLRHWWGDRGLRSGHLHASKQFRLHMTTSTHLISWRWSKAVAAISQYDTTRRLRKSISRQIVVITSYQQLLLIHFQNSFTDTVSSKRTMNWSLSDVATLPCEILRSAFEYYFFLNFWGVVVSLCQWKFENRSISDERYETRWLTFWITRHN